MDMYKQYQPVTWYIGIIEDSPEAVAEVIQPKYIPNKQLDGIYQDKKSIFQGLASLVPLGDLTKFLLVETTDGRTVLFNNFLSGAVELPTWSAAEELGVSAYYVCNVPNTISRNQRSGAWGARVLEYRSTKTPYNKEPIFGIHLINDAGRWCFYRYGEKQPFEDEKAYKARRKTERFTEKMLIDYCQALGIPVYDRDFYSDRYIIIEERQTGEQGMSYEEAAIKLRIEQD